MRKNKIGVLVLVLMLTMSVSCSRIGAPGDDAITTDIKAKMFSEPALKAATVDVVSKHGEVTLTGQVPNDAARLAAYKIATETKGVSRVNDQMSVAVAEMTVPQPAAPTPEAAPTKRTARTKVPPKAERSRQLAPDSPTTVAVAPRAKGSAEQSGGEGAWGGVLGGGAGGEKGGASGAAGGGGAGPGGQAFTKGHRVKIPSETRLDFTLHQPLEITYLPGKRSRQR